MVKVAWILGIVTGVWVSNQPTIVAVIWVGISAGLCFAVETVWKLDLSD